MKNKQFLIAGLVAAATLTGCAPKSDGQAEYKQLQDNLQAYIEEGEHTEQQDDSVITNLCKDAMAIARVHQGEEVCYTIFGELYYYLPMAEKGELIGMLNKDSILAKGMDKMVKSYEAEVLTQPGCEYIPFFAATPSGDTVCVSDYIGKTDYTLLDFWASWCGPCRRSMPALKELYAAADGHLQVVGISLDEDHEAWTKAISGLELEWPQMSDLQGWKSVPAMLYGVMAIPATVLIDRDGKIVARNPSHEEILGKITINN